MSCGQLSLISAANTVGKLNLNQSPVESSVESGFHSTASHERDDSNLRKRSGSSLANNADYSCSS